MVGDSGLRLFFGHRVRTLSADALLAYLHIYPNPNRQVHEHSYLKSLRIVTCTPSLSHSYCWKIALVINTLAFGRASFAPSPLVSRKWPFRPFNWYLLVHSGLRPYARQELPAEDHVNIVKSRYSDMLSRKKYIVIWRLLLKWEGLPYYVTKLRNLGKASYQYI